MKAKTLLSQAADKKKAAPSLAVFAAIAVLPRHGS
jgi:hypothetical protein